MSRTSPKREIHALCFFSVLAVLPPEAPVVVTRLPCQGCHQHPHTPTHPHAPTHTDNKSNGGVRTRDALQVREPKVGDLEMPRGVHEEVLGLQVAVRDAVLVDEVDAKDQLLEVISEGKKDTEVSKGR